MSIVAPVILLTSLIPAVVIFFLPERRSGIRTTLNLAGAVLKIGFVVALVPPVVGGDRIEWRTSFLPGIDLVLRLEPFALYFLGLSALLWLLTTIYAIGYLEGPNQSRFFAFFSLCVAATTGIALSGNLVTFLIFYELLTLATYPLVAHSQKRATFDGVRTYLAYTFSGGIVLLLGVVWLTYLVGPVEFREAGAPAVADLARERPATAIAIFVLLMIGLGVKAALFPLHGWLPRAMVAPAPVSALLHAVAVVKAGVFGIVLVIDDVFGVYVADDLGVLAPLVILACFTILYGSVQALRHDNVKARLAYSTVSQVSYVVLGASMVSVTATTGGVAHIVNQGLMKITMFFVAGILAETIGVTTVRATNGVGRRLPLTCTAFTIAALGMIGIPPIAGFVSKWYLGIGALEADKGWVVAVLVASSLLNAAYFLPIVYRMWWGEPDPATTWTTPPSRQRARAEAPLPLLVPTLVTALAAIAVGVFAGLPYSPLEMAQYIVEGTYGR
ncbi:monovalent cation/H+ antiporter subunit D family protein [Rhodococcus rhodnii]|uniref:Monovalent cation/H+ antiporter subunit D family protein n=2 Tax=Rhodococcus rhodnii TaxID=38312 RepID=A0A6P2CCA0_9NOCA|nr:proton-conducting transporter membrane subunit [Rhodococcus rhodnii]EOM74316.1 putative multisubunit sodium/proton antiporter MnhB subunit [Rhodococcus rhodnii LMG 5362]TXG89550.1 monovalent cation/H+ antiporter subunit D family protein [Rhodococcus rhodnii]